MDNDVVDDDDDDDSAAAAGSSAQNAFSLPQQSATHCHCQATSSSSHSLTRPLLADQFIPLLSHEGSFSPVVKYRIRLFASCIYVQRVPQFTLHHHKMSASLILNSRYKFCFTMNFPQQEEWSGAPWFKDYRGCKNRPFPFCCRSRHFHSCTWILVRTAYSSSYFPPFDIVRFLNEISPPL